MMSIASFLSWEVGIVKLRKLTIILIGIVCDGWPGRDNLLTSLSQSGLSKWFYSCKKMFLSICFPFSVVGK